MVFLSLPLYKGQTITTLAENGRKGFRALCAMVLETAEQAKVIFSTLVSYESQKVRFIKPAMVSHESRGLKGDFGRRESS